MMTNFDLIANGIKDFIQQYFLKNFDMSIPNFSFVKRALKEQELNQEIVSFKVLEDKVKKSISLNRVNNVYTD